jgi:aminoglycoside phosphotransferase (APT) family kinase protein
MADVIPADVIPVRDEEDFDRTRLAEYLRGRLEGSDTTLDVLQFGGGHANLTYLLRFGPREYVLRRPPLGPVAPTSHDMSREYRVLSVLYRAYPPAPRAFLYCDDPGIIGAPFFVMERRSGIVVRWAIPPEFGGGEDPAVNRQISEALIDSLADLHEVDYARVGLGDLGKPEGFLRRQVDGWAGRYTRAKTKDLAVVTEVIQWLSERLPPSPAATLVHNDWRLDNIMLKANDPGKVEAVFDWDMCTVGDPLADLGTLMASWAEAGEDFVGVAGRMPSTVRGFLTRHEATERYGRRRGVDVGRVPYYQVFGLFKLGVVLQQIYYRYHVGQTTDERFQQLDQLAEMLFVLAHERMQTGVL